MRHKTPSPPTQAATAATNSNARSCRIFCRATNPINRPTIAPPQYSETYRAAALWTHPTHRRLPQKRDHDAADRNLRAHIAKDSRRTKPQITKLPRPATRRHRSLAPLLNQVRQMNEQRKHRHRKRTASQNHIRHPHRMSKLRRRSPRRDKDKCRPNLRRNRRRQRVKSPRTDSAAKPPSPASPAPPHKD